MNSEQKYTTETQRLHSEVSTKGDSSERKLQRKLNAATRCNGVCRLAEAWCFEEANRNSEVCSVNKVEDLSPKYKATRGVEVEILDYGEVEFKQISRTESIATDSAVLTEWGKQTECVVSSQSNWLAAVARHDYACESV